MFAQRTGNSITSVTVTQRSLESVTFTAKAFVDASGDCDLAARGGAAVRYGNHGKVNIGSLGTRLGGLTSEARPTSVVWRDAIIKAKLQSPEVASRLHKDSSVLLVLPCGDIITFLASASYDATSCESITRAEQDGRRQIYECKSKVLCE